MLTDRQVQSFLKDQGYYEGKIDGDMGLQTWQAVLDFLDDNRNKLTASARRWGRPRRKVAVMQLAFKMSGHANPGPIDGLWGPSSQNAYEIYTGKVAPDWRDKEETKKVPAKVLADARKRSGTVYPRQKDVVKFYGNVGTNQTRLVLPAPMRIAWDLDKKITRFSCHRKVHDDLKGIFEETLAHYGEAQWRKLGLDLFGGCLNVRKMRGGSRYSMHSWGIAVDIDPARNQLRWKKNKARLARPEYEAFWKIVEAHGATSLGRVRDFDWMHLQFARL